MGRRSSRSSRTNTACLTVPQTLGRGKPKVVSCLTYLRNTLPLLRSLASGASVVQSPLLPRILQEIAGFETFIATGQFGSKALEAIVGALTKAAVYFDRDRTDDIRAESAAAFCSCEEIVFSVQRLFAALTQQEPQSTATADGDGCTSVNPLFFLGHQYASYVIEALLKPLPLYLKLEEVNAQASHDHKVDPSEPGQCLQSSFNTFLEYVTENSFQDLICHPAGSHIARATLLAAAGYASLERTAYVCGSQEEEASSCHQPQAGRLNLDRCACPSKGNTFTKFFRLGNPSFRDFFYTIAQDTIEFLQTEDLLQPDSSLATNTYAAPVLQLMIEILHANEVDLADDSRPRGLLHAFCGIYLSPPSVENTDQWTSYLDGIIESAGGSRLLETCVCYAVPNQVHDFIWKFLFPRDRLRSMAVAPYGNRVVQSILRCDTLNEASLKFIIEGLDYSQLLEVRYSAVIWRLADSCRRLGVHFKSFFSRLIKAYCTSYKEVAGTAAIWWCVLCGEPFDRLHKVLQERQCLASQSGDVPQTIATTRQDDAALHGKKKATTDSISSDVDDNNNNCFQDPDILVAGEIGMPKGSKLRGLDFTGCSIVASLMKFPSDAVGPFLQSFPAFCRGSKSLLALATHRLGSWVIQALLDCNSSIGDAGRARLVKALLPQVVELAFHPQGSFVVSAMYNAASISQKRSMIEFLVPKSEVLRSANYALFRALEFPLYCNGMLQWQGVQDKKSKFQRMFQDIVGTPVTPAPLVNDENQPPKTGGGPEVQESAVTTPPPTRGARVREAVGKPSSIDPVEQSSPFLVKSVKPIKSVTSEVLKVHKGTRVGTNGVKPTATKPHSSRKSRSSSSTVVRKERSAFSEAMVIEKRSKTSNGYEAPRKLRRVAVPAT